MRVLIDYRAALRERSGVGEYTHQIAAALLTSRASIGTTADPVDLTLFSSSWKDRLSLDPALRGATAVDQHVPVRLLNLAWHRLEWPSAEMLCGAEFDVVHSLHPLLLPARRAAQVVTVHDLNFLTHPDRARAEIRRDYAALARGHAQRADRVVVVSEFTRQEVEKLLGVSPDRISVCSPGAPSWPPREGPPTSGYVLFFGTLEPRKNVGALLDAYALLASRRRDLPELLLAGKATAEAQSWLARIERPPLKGLVRHIGYISPDGRRDLYAGAHMLVQPSFDEGFGLPVLEAMATGVPVVAARRGALPEVLGGAGILVDPDDRDQIASAILHILDDPGLAATLSAKGLERSRVYTWANTARRTMDAYVAAIEHRSARRSVA